MKRISNVDLRLLRIFASVVESNGFTAAQLDLNISVSSISTYIAALEERLGVRLCQRGRTGFPLTEKGAIIYREAKRLFATLDEFGVMAATVRGRLTGTLRLGFVDCTVTNPNSPISRAIGRFNNRDHEVTSEVSVGPPAELQRGVLDGSLILRWPAFLPRSPNWSPSRFMAKSIDSTVAPATACSTARQSASTISPAAGSSRAATGAASTCRAIGRRTACGIGQHHGSRGNPYSVGRVFGLSAGALCLALGRCGQVALHPSRKTELCGRLLQHKSLLPPVRQFMEDLRMSSARLFSRPGTRKGSLMVETKLNHSGMAHS